MATQSTAGAEKLAIIMRPIIAEVQASQTQVLREFVREEVAKLRDSTTAQLQEIMVTIHRLGAIIDTLDEKTKRARPAEANPITRADIIELNTSMAEIRTMIAQIPSQTVQAVQTVQPKKPSIVDIINAAPDRVKGLPSNVIMRETGPAKNMFTHDDDLDLDFD